MVVHCKVSSRPDAPRSAAMSCRRIGENLVRRKMKAPPARKMMARRSEKTAVGLKPSLPPKRPDTPSAMSASVKTETAETARAAARCLRASSSCVLSAVGDTVLPRLYEQGRLMGANDSACGNFGKILAPAQRGGQTGPFTKQVRTPRVSGGVQGTRGGF